MAQNHHYIQLLKLKPSHVFLVENMTFHHRDPFDRLIIARALQEGLKILTKDKVYSKYIVDIIR